MPRPFRQQLISKISAFACLTLITAVAMARSALFDHPAQVVLKDGAPCFFADFGDVHWSGYNLTVTDNADSAAGMAWVISTTDHAERPSAPQSCVSYGQVLELVKTIKAPAPLRSGRPYLAIIDAGGHSRYGIRFCLSKGAQEKSVLTKWGQDGASCTSEPLNQEVGTSAWGQVSGK